MGTKNRIVGWTQNIFIVSDRSIVLCVSQPLGYKTYACKTLLQYNVGSETSRCVCIFWCVDIKNNKCITLRPRWFLHENTMINCNCIETSLQNPQRDKILLSRFASEKKQWSRMSSNFFDFCSSKEYSSLSHLPSQLIYVGYKNCMLNSRKKLIENAKHKVRGVARCSKQGVLRPTTLILGSYRGIQVELYIAVFRFSLRQYVSFRAALSLYSFVCCWCTRTLSNIVNRSSMHNFGI